MKKLSCVIISLILLFSSVFCYPISAVTECNHEGQDLSYIIEDEWDGGCHSGVYLEGWCNLCDDYIYEKIDDKHNWQFDSVAEPDCTNDGYTRYKCLYCGTNHDIPIPALGHDGELTFTEAVRNFDNYDSTNIENYCYCVEKYYDCKVCGKSYCEEEYFYDHKFSDTLDGWSACTGFNRCTVCELINQEKTDELREQNHNWVTEKYMYEVCDFGGSERVYCSSCYEEKSITYFPATGHTWEITVITEPDCETIGRSIYKCTTCGWEEENWDYNQHKKGELLRTVEATCNCVSYNVYSCSLCGVEFETDYGKEYAEHLKSEYWGIEDYSNACTVGVSHRYYCYNCENDYVLYDEPTGHNWKVEYVDNYDPCITGEITTYYCTNDNCYVEPLQVITKEPTGHNWIEFEEHLSNCRYFKGKDCTNCYQRIVTDEYTKHTYEETTYNECGKIGYTYKKCTTCEYWDTSHDVIIFNNGHTFEKKRVYDKASKKYVYRHVCSSCGMHNGDMNSDNTVNLKDLVKMKKELAGLNTKNIFDYRDCTQDSNLDSLDLNYIRKIILDIID